MKPTLVLDFDGVIHSYTSRWHSATIISDPPVDGAFDFIRRAVKSFTVVICTSRMTGTPAQLRNVHFAISDWFSQYDLGIELHEYSAPIASRYPEHIFISHMKPPAHITIDDRALTFTGFFPQSKHF